MRTLLLPEIVKTIKRKLRHIHYRHLFESKSDQLLELEELALESFELTHQLNSNLLRMIEIERSLNTATELANSREMRTCRRLLKKIQEVSGVEDAMLMRQPKFPSE
ncbi:hypothetical protein QN360_17505 [Glaciimonas sp. CA11.2]|uniref:hypothetical protein n=1 Tax=unclassified Glaciimonas TaxID=2644401 RepID=UPI002AB3E3D6|nr:MULTISPECIES: hypothetical protein [unclassified Glaciimonas]MDY7545219.1 hypothetical protein [Glaciimonas sp. CA11.2]MEB0011267.1 hypothetical protein [Glaciimonas sp. Cout2]MEB0080917.1 hypothetical protein [Glaciimonas sp. Gout2]MEB0164694.1 hypothetical protein [Glaciimonas sp. CA11.2]